MAIKIRLTQDAHIEGYKGAEYRLTTDAGKPSAYVIRDNWYEATATDKDDNMYLVVWRIKDGFDVYNDPDESDACNWDEPAEIIRLDTGENVTDRAKIEW